MKKLSIIIASLCVTAGLVAQDLSAFQLSCHYPMTAGPADSAGQCDSLQYQNVSFGTDGAYLNGIYFDGSTPNACFLKTSVLSALQKPSFAVSLEFKLQPDGQEHPVMVIGPLWRFIKVLVDDLNQVGTAVNDGAVMNYGSPLDPTKWHHLVIIHTGPDSLTRFYIDGNLHSSFSETLHAPGSDRAITADHGGSGKVFRGWWRHLKVYEPKATAGISAGPFRGNLKLAPNPVLSGGAVQLDGVAGAETVTLTDLSGRRYISRRLAGRRFQIPSLPKGVYLVQVQSRDGVRYGRLVVVERP